MSDSNDPVEQFISLLENPRVQAFFDNLVNTAVKKKIKESYETLEFKTAVETVIVTSEQKILPRLQDIEKITGQWDFEGDEHAPTLPERIEALEKNTVLAPEKLIEENKDENPIIANTTLTKKASALTEYLEKKTKANWSGKIVLENQDIYNFFKEIIQEDLRWPEKMRGYRGAKKSIIERAQELFPHKVEVVRNKSGNKITGLALKPSVKRTDTNGC
jgi:hypothetical protein